MSETLAAKIKALRIRRNISQSQFAELVGVGVQSIHKWETGKHKPHQQYLNAIIKATGVHESYFDNIIPSTMKDSMSNDELPESTTISDLPYDISRIVTQLYEMDYQSRKTICSIIWQIVSNWPTVEERRPTLKTIKEDMEWIMRNPNSTATEVVVDTPAPRFITPTENKTIDPPLASTEVEFSPEPIVNGTGTQNSIPASAPAQPIVEPEPIVITPNMDWSKVSDEQLKNL